MPQARKADNSSSLGDDVVSNAQAGGAPSDESAIETKKQKRMDTCAFSESLSKMTMMCSGDGECGTSSIMLVVTREDFETIDKIIGKILNAATHGELKQIVNVCQSLEIMPTAPDSKTISKSHVTREEKLIVLEAEIYSLLLMGAYRDLLDLFDRGRGFFPDDNDKFKTLEIVGTYLFHHLPGKAMETLLQLVQNFNNKGVNASPPECQMLEHLVNAVRIRSFHDILCIYKNVKMSYVAELLGLKSDGDTMDGDSNISTCVLNYFSNQGITSPYIWSEREGKNNESDGVGESGGVGESNESMEKEIYLIPAPFAAAKLLKEASTSSTDVRFLRLADARSSIVDGHQSGDDEAKRLDHLARVVTYMEHRQTNV